MNLKEFLINNHFDLELIDLALNARKFSKTRELSTEEKKEILNSVDKNIVETLYYNFSLPIYKIAMLYGLNDVSFRQKMISFGFNLKGHCVGKNSNNEYFSEINSYDKAYFLGLIAADGSIVNNTLSLELKSSDKYILELFIEKGDFETTLIKDNRENRLRYIFRIHSKNIIEKLSEFFILPRKSYNDSLKIPDIKKEFMRDYIRGYFDGNGIANKLGYVGFCGSETIISEIKNHLVETLNISNNKTTYNKSNKIYYIQWGKVQDTKKIFNYLYEGINDCYLIRKKEKISKRLTGLL